MASAGGEIVVHSSNAVGTDVEALVQAAVSVLSNDMQLPTQNQLQEQVQVVMEGAPDLRQERLYMCTDCNLAFYGENGEAEWQWHLKQHQPFKCDLCSESFSQKQNLAQHMRTHSIQMPFICEQCGSAYSLKANLAQHMKVHEIAQQLRCQQCDSMFVYQSHLDRHIKMVHTGEPIKIYACDICGKQFTQQKNLVQHSKIHQEGDKPYKCNECPASYSYKCHLTRHLIIHTGEKPYRCKFCGKAFNRNAHLVRHRKIHSDAEKKYRCEECNFAFWEKSDLQRHIRSHAGNRPFKCEFCEQTFTWRRYLLKHLNIHHKDDSHFFCTDCCACFESEDILTQHAAEAHSNKKQLTHTCMHCGEEFYFKYKLDEHTFQHTGIKSHKCEKCSAAFVSRKELERHVADHSMEVSFHCNTCDQNFASIQDLQAHVTLHAGRGKFVCGECNISFKWKSQLKAHMITHSENRAFPCPTCGKDFKRVKDMKRHQRVYHETKPPYTCTECNQDFHTPFNLMKHEKSAHSLASKTERGYECHHCSGAFKLKEDLDLHMKIHMPKPYICSTCNKEFSKLKFMKKHLSLKHGIEEAVENEHYTKIVIKSEIEDNDNEEGEVNGTDNVTYDGIQDMSFDGSQEDSYVEMNAAEPNTSEAVQQIEIVPLSGNESQIIIESIQGASQTNIQPSESIASNVSIPKVVMIRGGVSASSSGNQNQGKNVQGQQAATQSSNKLTTENILLQLAQQAQLQKPIPAQPKVPVIQPVQNISSMASKLPTSVSLQNIITVTTGVPTVASPPNIIRMSSTSLSNLTQGQNIIKVVPSAISNVSTGQTVSISSRLPTVAPVQNAASVSPNIPSLQNIVNATSIQNVNNSPSNEPSGDYVNVISMIPSVVNAEEGMEEEQTVSGDVDGNLIRVEVLQEGSGEGDLHGQPVDNI